MSFVLFFSSVLALLLISPPSIQAEKQPILEPGAYLAINSLGLKARTKDNNSSAVIRRRLEINWYGIDGLGSDVQVGLYDRPPADFDTSGLILFLNPSDYPDGFMVTDIQLPVLSPEQIGYQSQCVFPYWVRLETSLFESITTPRCLQSQPQWMMDNRDLFGDLQLGELMMVASHDAASYRQFEGDMLDNFITAIIFTQEEDLGAQLQYGSRLLDIRIGHYPSTPEKFWLVHGPAPERPLATGIPLVQDYLRNTRDIIIWDSHSFTNSWDPTVHNEYESIIRSAFGQWWVQPRGNGWNMTLNEIWDTPGLPQNEGRIVMMYENKDHFDPEWHFPNTIERWGDKNTPASLKSYLDQVTNEARNDPLSFTPWRPNCQMTPHEIDIAIQRYSGLREMADLVNRNVTLWWRTDYRDLANAQTLHDYFLGTDMVQVAIERNTELAKWKLSWKED